MRARLHTLALMTAAAIALGACGGSKEVAAPTGSPSPATPSHSPSPDPPQAAAAITYTYLDDVYVFDVATNKTTRLTSTPDAQEVSPRFRDANTISYALGPAIVETRLSSGETTRTRNAPGDVQQMDWSPDGTKLAVLYDRGDKNGTGLTLRIEDFAGGQGRNIRDFKPWLGRGAGDDDEVRVFWSPGGSQLLVVITPLDHYGTTMFVVDLDGADVIPPRFATMGRWSSDGSSVVFRDFEAKGSWHSVTTATGAVSDLVMTRSTVRPEFSPDGTRIAYDRAGADPGLFVFDLRTRKETVISAAGRIGALWLDNDSLLVSRVKKCLPDGGCEGAWVPEYRTSRISATGGTEAGSPVQWTLYADVLYA